MSKVKSFSAGFAVITIAAGVLFGILPRNWIELFFHADPDGGSGILEVLFALGLIAMGAGIVLYAARRRSRAETIAPRTSRRFFPLSHR
jgi:O-antigen/teichoic acid export membrane protein